MDWQHYNRLTELVHMGKLRDALAGFVQLKNDCQETPEEVLTLLAIANCYLLLGDAVHAKQAVEEAFKLVDRDSELYVRVAFKDLTIDMQVRDWDKALTKIDVLLGGRLQT